MRWTMARPDAGALVVLGAVQALEDAEELADVLHVEAHAVVAHKVGTCSPSCSSQPTSMWATLALAGELEGIGQQVDEDLLEQGGVGLAGRQVADDDLDLPPILLGAAGLPAPAATTSAGATVCLLSGWRLRREKASRSSTSSPICCVLLRTRSR